MSKKAKLAKGTNGIPIMKELLHWHASGLIGMCSPTGHVQMGLTTKNDRQWADWHASCPNRQTLPIGHMVWLNFCSHYFFVVSLFSF
jgi:hypothetical protein